MLACAEVLGLWLIACHVTRADCREHVRPVHHQSVLRRCETLTSAQMMAE